MPNDYSSEGKLSLFPYDPRYRPISPPTAGIFDAPTTQICLNVEWVGHIEGVLDRLLWRDAWQGDFSTQEWAIAQIRKLLIQFIQRNPCGDDEMPYLLRQNPTNKCQLQQSVDGGVTWSLAFDYSLCIPRSNAVQNYTVYNQIQQTIHNYNQTWNSNPTVNNYAPNMVYDESSDDINRDIIICYAIGVFYDMVVKGYVELVASNNDEVAAVGGTLAGAAVSTFGTPFAGALVGVIVGGLVKLMATVGAGIQQSTLEAGRDEVICCMYTGLRGETPTETRFQQSVDSCDLEGDAEIARSILQPLLQGHDVYLAFLRFANEGFQFAESGLLPDCPCVVECYTWNFDIGESGWTLLYGEYGPGPLERNTFNGAVEGSETFMRIQYDFASPVNINSIELHTIHADMYVTVETDAGYIVNEEYRPALGGAEDTFTYTTPAEGVEWLKIIFRRDVPDSDMHLFDVKINYVGDEPTGGEEC